MLRLLGLSLGMLELSLVILARDSDEHLAGRVSKIDPLFQKALAELAKKYDAEKDPKAAHFYVECAPGFGLKDPKIPVIKGAYETDLYVGKLRGGVVQESRETAKTGGTSDNPHPCVASHPGPLPPPPGRASRASIPYATRAAASSMLLVVPSISMQQLRVMRPDIVERLL